MLLQPARASALTLATWAGGTGVWSNPAQWSSNPLYPCNGNGAESFDVQLASGAVTLDLTCAIEAFSLSGGTLDGSFELTVGQLLTWNGGTLAGSGTTRALAGAAIGGAATKSFAGTRTLELAGGSSTWSTGSISLGSGGATLRNGSASQLTVTGASGRVLSDGGGPGHFENDGVLSCDLAAPGNLVTLSPGSLVQNGAVHVNTGILAFNGDGSHGGSFDGAGTLRFSGGTQTLVAGASVTTADTEVTGGALTLQPDAELAVANLDLTGAGTLILSGPATTGTMTLSGTLAGASDLETSALLTWSGGTMSGSGTTRALAGAAISGGATKSFTGMRTLELAGGSSDWSGGSISLGNGGATLRNAAGSQLSVTGTSARSLSDAGGPGHFENDGVLSCDLAAATTLVTLSPGSLVQNGVVHVNTGILALNGGGSHGGSFDGAGTLRFSGGAQTLVAGASVTTADTEVTGAALTVQPGAQLAVANLDLTNGALTLSGPATAGTMTLSAGTLTGASDLETSALLGWSGGTMSGSGTMRALGGAAISGAATKIFAGSRTLALAGGSSTWSAGSISLGGGGATLRNESASQFTVTGASRALSDTGDTGRFENLGSFAVALDGVADALTLSPGVFLNSGVIDLVQGNVTLQTSFAQFAGVTRLHGVTLTATTPLNFYGGSLEGNGVLQADVLSGGRLSPGFSAGQLGVVGNLALGSAGELRAEIGGLGQGTSYDFVQVTGGAALAGELTLLLLAGFEAIGVDDSLTILEAGTPLGGAFSNVASGQRLTAVTGDGSFVVHYGAGSPFGANRVVLSGFVPFVPAATLIVSGGALGGAITLTVAGVELVVPTSAGQTAAQVAAAIGAAINADATLAAQGVVAVVNGSEVVSSGDIATAPVSTDPGVTVSLMRAVPALPALAVGLLGVLLGAFAVRVSGARRR